MPRKLRFDYPGAMHHVFMRGVARSPIALDDADSEHALFLLARTVSRFEIRCHGWCYLPNHAHFLFTSELGNLSRAMQHLAMCMAQAFNQRYDRPGHLFQSRFGSRLISDDGYLLELARYLPLNPVRAGLCDEPADWPWSSYAATAGLTRSPWYLDSSKVIETIGSVEEFVGWVAEGQRGSALDEHGIPLPPPKPSLASLLPEDSDRGIAIAHFSHGYSKRAIAKHLGVSDSQIGRRLA